MNLEIKNVNVGLAIGLIIHNRGVVMLGDQNLSSESELTPEMVAKIIVILSFEDRDENEIGNECITIGEIDTVKSNGTLLSFNDRDKQIEVSSQMFKSLLLLKMYSTGFGVITA